MRIGIFTYHRSLNCGAVLQAWALMTFLRKLGFAAEIVNYGCIGRPVPYTLSFTSLREFVRSIYYDIRRMMGGESLRRCRYDAFLRQFVNLGIEVSREQLANAVYSHVITGSDQVWHPIINEGDSTYYLSFADTSVKRISYAASFGVDWLPDDVRVMAECELQKFFAISVREPAGAGLVKRLCNRSADVVCDPTLLLDVDDYVPFEKTIANLPKSYVLAYLIGSHPWALKFAQKVARENNIALVCLQGGKMVEWMPFKKMVDISTSGPSEFLSAIHHASYVVTNSFHGTAFSLIYRRPFAVALNANAGDERMRNIAQKVGLSHRLVECLNQKIPLCHEDWAVVDDGLANERMHAMDFLKRALM